MHIDLQANLHPESTASLTRGESELPPAKSMTWVREDEPAIEVSGPVLVNPFADWAPRAMPGAVRKHWVTTDFLNPEYFAWRKIRR